MRTLVVSWKDAADRKESVARDAFVSTEKRDFSGRRLKTFFFHSCVRLIEFALRIQGSGKKLRISRLIDFHLAQHLAYDYFDMLIVDIYALHLIYTLNFFDEILVYAFHTVNSQNIMRIERTLSDTVSSLDKVSFFYLQTRAVRDDIDHLLVAHNFDFCFIVFSRFDGHHRTVSFADFCETLRLSRLEKFFYSRKTLGNIPAGYTARMERTHGELCARFSDGLRRHDDRPPRRY